MSRFSVFGDWILGFYNEIEEQEEEVDVRRRSSPIQE